MVIKSVCVANDCQKKLKGGAGKTKKNQRCHRDRGLVGRKDPLGLFVFAFFSV